MDSLTPYFRCSRVNTSTFVIREDDEFGEHPFIYAKIYPQTVILIDTGCGGFEKGHDARNLRDFLETEPIITNDNLPINSWDEHGRPSKQYLRLCTHCHYDHILGLKHFNDDIEIVASEEGKAFIEHDLAEHSLCKFLDIPPPHYKVTKWASDWTQLYAGNVALKLLCISTPGHTPDSMAVYDQDERHLYVGDSFYERVAKDKSYEQAIIFPKEGNWIDFMLSMRKLQRFIEIRDRDEGYEDKPVKINCGHVSTNVLGSEILDAVKQLFLDVIDGKVPIVHQEEKRGESFVTFQAKGNPRFSVATPKRLVEDAQRKRSEWD